MAQPTPYVITTDFSQEEAQGVAGRSTLRNPALDVELENIRTSLNQAIANLGVIQRDDTGLRDGIVQTWTLSADVLALIASGAFVLRGNLLTATDYAVGNVVRSGTGTYVCIEAHTSGVFATDYAALKWTVLFDAATIAASSISFTPAGSIAAANVQAAIEEAANEALQKAANLSDLANVATARSNLSVFSKAEVQSLSGTFAVAGGTADAITAAFTPVFASWAAVALVVVECSGANTSTTPTLAVDGLGAKTITDPAGSPLAVGAIPGANFRGLFAYDASLDKVVLLNPYGALSLGALSLASSSLGQHVAMINGKIVHSRAGNAETISIKTFSGNDPTAGDPVKIVFRSATATDGGYEVLTLTAATSFTISSSSTLGASNGVPFRLWIVGFNDGGTFRLGVINCRSGTDIYPLGGWSIASATAEGGAGGADSAHVFYAGAGVASKAYTVLGYSSWESGLATAGTWDTAPTRTQLFGPQVPLPGQVIQSRFASLAGASVTSASYVDVTNTTLAITQQAAPNLVRVRYTFNLQSNTGASGTANDTFVQILRAAVVLLADEVVDRAATAAAAAQKYGQQVLEYMDFPAAAGSHSYKMQLKNNGTLNCVVGKVKVTLEEIHA
jgi:hypothetical protein